MDDPKLLSKNEIEIASSMQTVRLFSEDIGIECGIGKCATLVMRRGW